MNEPFFSVLVPVYNVEEYIDCCLKSIINQTYKNFEIILVDDGSKDNSGKICDAYQDKYVNIKVIHKENQGQLSARLVGLKYARGKYVVYVDSDDYIELDTLQKIHDVINTYGSDVVIYKWKIIDEKNNLLSDNVNCLFLEGVISKDQIFKTLINSSNLNSMCIKCFMRELCDLNIDYSRYYQYKNAEDLLQTLPILAKASSFYYLNEALYSYRMNLNSVTHTFKKGSFKVLNIVRPILYDYIKKLDFDTEENVQNFYNFYIDTIWRELYGVYNNLNFYETKQCSKEIYLYEHVLRSKKYLMNSNIMTIKKIGLFLFYGKHWYLLKIYFTLLNYLLDIRKKINLLKGE